ncbi:hypothetical protein ANN_04688, partial [Periplaneta americana]
LDSNDVRKAAYKSSKVKHNFSEAKQMAGKAWLIKFMERNPHISLRKAEGLSSARCSDLDKEDVMEYFSLLRKTNEEFDLMDKPQMI